MFVFMCFCKYICMYHQKEMESKTDHLNIVNHLASDGLHPHSLHSYYLHCTVLVTLTVLVYFTHSYHLLMTTTVQRVGLQREGQYPATTLLPHSSTSHVQCPPPCPVTKLPVYRAKSNPLREGWYFYMPSVTYYGQHRFLICGHDA